MLDPAKQRAASTYNAASDHFDDPVLGFWDLFGSRTVARIGLQSGSRVLDVCCGTGASALPAAELVGESGSVTGVDLAEKLLELAREKAKVRGIRNASFYWGDMTDLEFPSGSFDAVVNVFGVFFVPDMVAALKEMWRVVKPGGVLAITTWGPNVLQPGTSTFWDAVLAVRPDLHQAFFPWERIKTTEELQGLFSEAGVTDFEAVTDSAPTPLNGPEDWWKIVLGTGYRTTIDQLDREELEAVRKRNLTAMADVAHVENDVIYGLARK